MHDGNLRWSKDAGPAVAVERRGQLHLLLCLLGAAFVMAITTSVEGALFRIHRGEIIDWSSLLVGRLADWYSCAILVPPLYWLATRFTIEAGDWRRPAAIHLAASATAACLKFLLYVPFRQSFDPAYNGTILDALRTDFLGKTLFFVAIIGILHAILFHRRGHAEVGRAARAPRVPPCQGRGDTIALPTGTGLRLLPMGDIDWVEAQGNYLRIHAGGDRHLVRQTMRDLAGRLDPRQFVRVHRSMIVNAASVRGIEPARNSRYRLILRDGRIVTSGRSYVEAVRRLPL